LSAAITTKNQLVIGVLTGFKKADGSDKTMEGLMGGGTYKNRVVRFDLETGNMIK
jgi:hypothetical protein